MKLGKTCMPQLRYAIINTHFVWQYSLTPDNKVNGF
jgi:hypothetical protein